MSDQLTSNPVNMTIQHHPELIKAVSFFKETLQG